MSDAPLLFRDVRVGAGGVSFTFDVPAHTVVSIEGSERSGVLRLGQVALGLQRPWEGSCLLRGRDPGELQPRELRSLRRTVGYLPTDDGLLQNLTLHQNVALPLRFGSQYSDREINSRVDIILAALRIGDVARERPAFVGDEERRRAAIARALAFDPELVILEQPFEGLTTRTCAELLEILRGGESELGPRRSLLILGRQLPHLLRGRVERRYRARKELILESE